MTFPGLYYSVSGGYGFESTLTDDQYDRLLAKKAGTIDLDVKIVFDKNQFTRFFDDSEDGDMFFFETICGNIQDMLLTQGLISVDDISNSKVIGITDWGVVWFDRGLKLDLLITSIDRQPSLAAFLKTDENLTHWNWKSEYVIFDTLHMFMVCYFRWVFSISKMHRPNRPYFKNKEDHH